VKFFVTVLSQLGHGSVTCRCDDGIVNTNTDHATVQGLRIQGPDFASQRAHAEAPGEVVRNLRFLLSAKELRELVSSEVARLDWQNPEVAGYLTRYPGYRPQVLLSILVLAYATQEFESEGISTACEKDFEFRTICSGRSVEPQELIKFRRGNRPLVEVVLARVLQQAVTRVQTRRLAKSVLADEPWFLAEAKRRLDLARHFDTLD